MKLLKALANDHEYLLKGDVFTEDVIETWIKYKMDKEVKPMALAAASIMSLVCITMFNQ